jgi:GNAT superfamily N-acetyltransferase
MNRPAWPINGRRFRLLHASDLDSLPLCQTCKEMEKLVKDRAWARAGDDEWGFCGVGVYVAGQPVAYALVTAALYVPARHPLARGANADAAALLALYVEGAHTQHVLGKQAIQRLAANLVDQRNINAIDAASSERGVCQRPSRGFLAANGFRPLDDGVRHRLDLRGTRVWLPSPQEMVRQVADIVRPATPPQPAGRADPGLSATHREPVGTR